MEIEIIKSFIFNEGVQFNDVIDGVLIEGFRNNDIIICKVSHWKKSLLNEKDYPINAYEMGKIIEKIGKNALLICVGRFSKTVYKLLDKINTSCILIDDKIRIFGFVPPHIVKKLLIVWEVIKNEIVEK